MGRRYEFSSFKCVGAAYEGGSIINYLCRAFKSLEYTEFLFYLQFLIFKLLASWVNY